MFGYPMYVVVSSMYYWFEGFEVGLNGDQELIQVAL